jgi:hypothetical protein
MALNASGPTATAQSVPLFYSALSWERRRFEFLSWGRVEEPSKATARESGSKAPSDADVASLRGGTAIT